jgi:hypothetical protein
LAVSFLNKCSWDLESHAGRAREPARATPPAFAALGAASIAGVKATRQHKKDK